jgi:FixJ family two-component response regulator
MNKVESSTLATVAEATEEEATEEEEEEEEEGSTVRLMVNQRREREINSIVIKSQSNSLVHQTLPLPPQSQLPQELFFLCAAEEAMGMGSVPKT